MQKLPVYSKDLILSLDKQYPPRSPKITDSDREIFFYSGQRKLVESLLSHLSDGVEGEQEIPKLTKERS